LLELLIKRENDVERIVTFKIGEDFGHLLGRHIFENARADFFLQKRNNIRVEIGAPPQHQRSTRFRRNFFQKLGFVAGA